MAETKAITLDLKLPNNTVVRANQYDSNSTAIQIRLTSQGKKYTVPPENDVYVKVKSPSGKMILNKCFINSNGTVNVILTKNMTATAGRCRAQLIIADHGHTPIEEDEEVTYTSSFIINVVKSVYSGEEFKQSSESDVFFDYVNQAKQSAEKAEKAAAVTGTGMKMATSDSIGAVKPDNKTTFVDENGVLRAVSNDVESVNVDSELNNQSTNPIANKAVAEKFDAVDTKIATLSDKVDNIKIPEIPEIPTPVYDAELNSSSENAVQNKALTAKFEEISEQIQDAKNASSSITVDKEIADSDNPVENRAVKAALEELASRIGQNPSAPGEVELVDSKPDTYYDFASIGLYDLDAAKIYVVQSYSSTPPEEFPESNTCNYTVKSPQTIPLGFWLKTENVNFSDLKIESDNKYFVPQMQERMGYVRVSVSINLENIYTVTAAKIKISSATNNSVSAEILIDYSVKQSAQGVRFNLSNAAQPVGNKVKIDPTWYPAGVPAPEYTVKKTVNGGATTLSYEDGFYYLNVVDAGRDEYAIVSDENENVSCTFTILGLVQNSPIMNANPSLNLDKMKKTSDGSAILTELKVSDEMLDENNNFEFPRTISSGTQKYPVVIDADTFTLTLDTTKDIDTLSFAKNSVSRIGCMKVVSDSYTVKNYKLANVTTDTYFQVYHAYKNEKTAWYDISNNKTITVDYEGADLSKLTSLNYALWNNYGNITYIPGAYKRVNPIIANSAVNGTYSEKEWDDYKDYDATCVVKNLIVTNPATTVRQFVPCFPHVKFENCSINVTSADQICANNKMVRTIEGLGASINHDTLESLSNGFYNCHNLESVDIFDNNPYPSLKNVSKLFSSTGALTSMTVDVTGVTDMTYMFGYSYVFNTIKVTGKPAAGCTDVLNFTSGTTAKVVDVSDLDLSNQDSVSIFSNYSYIETLDLSKTKFKDGVTLTNVVPFDSGQYYTLKNFVLPSNISKATITATKDTSTVFQDASGNMYYEQPKFNIDGLVLTNTFVQTYDYKKKKGGNN